MSLWSACRFPAAVGRSSGRRREKSVALALGLSSESVLHVHTSEISVSLFQPCTTTIITASREREVTCLANNWFLSSS